MNEPKQRLPFKSVAGALWFAALLGPIGLLYSSTLGGVIMIILGFVTVCAKYPVPIAMVWIGSCIWSVAAANKYNEKIINR